MEVEMKEFVKVPFVERLIGYADEVRMSINLDGIGFNNEYELKLKFKEKSDNERYLIMGIFIHKEILLKEPYRGEELTYLLGYRENVLSILKIDEKDSEVLEYDMGEWEKADKMISTMVNEYI